MFLEAKQHQGSHEKLFDRLQNIKRGRFNVCRGKIELKSKERLTLKCSKQCTRGVYVRG